MTTELEEQFFKTFGIEPECVRGCGEYYFENGNIDAWNVFDCKNSDCSKCEHDKSIWRYPEITDRKLLKMICILQRFKDITFNNLYFENIEHLKNEVLSQVYKCKLKLHEFNAKQLQHQIQQLFKEEE